MRKRPPTTACLLLVAAVSGAQAQTYRCERDGKIAFSDRPCEAGAKETRKDYAASGASGVLDLEIALNYFTVHGQDYASLLQSVNANGPRGFHGMAGWKVTYQYTTKQRRDACQIDTVRVKISGEILMPRWAPSLGKPPALLDHPDPLQYPRVQPVLPPQIRAQRLAGSVIDVHAASGHRLRERGVVDDRLGGVVDLLQDRRGRALGRDDQVPHAVRHVPAGLFRCRRVGKGRVALFLEDREHAYALAVDERLNLPRLCHHRLDVVSEERGPGLRPAGVRHRNHLRGCPEDELLEGSVARPALAWRPDAHLARVRFRVGDEVLDGLPRRAGGHRQQRIVGDHVDHRVVLVRRLVGELRVHLRRDDERRLRREQDAVAVGLR